MDGEATIKNDKLCGFVREWMCLFTSRCLVASSLRDISISLVRMLRKCMSLRRVARFTVVSFVDCEEN